MSSTYGERLRFTIFGQSHSPAIGVTVEGLPAGITIDMEKLQAFLERRAPGNAPTATARKEPDRPKFLSGLVGNVTCGTPLTAIIENTNTRSGDYEALRNCPRPGHADFPAHVKYGGHQDVAGGGHFSGRLTAPVCIVGGICLQILEQMGIAISAEVLSIGAVSGSWEEMEREILSAKAHGDSVGGIIQCTATGLPVGWGDPMFGGMENRIAQAVFGIPAVKGIEFGLGFAAAQCRGSENNDPYYIEGDEVKTKTNHHGGILGGITTGMPLVFRAAIKPTPSIAKEQDSVSLSEKTDRKLTVHGRHDPCIVPRALPVVEAAAAVAIYDAYLCSL